MKKVMLMILAGSILAQSTQALADQAPIRRYVASQEQTSSQARDAIVAIRNQARAILESGKSEVSAQDLKALSAATATLTPLQRLEVLETAIIQLHQVSHYLAQQSGTAQNAAAQGVLVVYSVIAGCLTTIMFVNDNEAKTSFVKWIGVVVTAASIGGVVGMMVKGNPEADRLEEMTEELTKALRQAQRATVHQIQAESLL